MSNYINDALLDASPYKKQQEEAKALVGKWDKTGLLDGLNEDFQKNGMAVMLENQAKQLINENSGTGGTAGTGTATNAGSEEWSGVALPLVRRIFGEIAAQDFVSVQPMNLPSGLVFYLDFKYGKTTEEGSKFGGDLAGHANVPGNDVNSLGGKTGDNSPIGSSAPFGVGGLYGEGRYDYSINQKASGSEVSPSKATATYKDINFNQDLSSSLAATKIHKITVPKPSDADEKAVRSFGLSGSSNFMSGSIIQPQFTKINGENIEFIVSQSDADATLLAASSAIKVLYSVAPTENNRGDFEDTVGSAVDDTLAIPEVDLQLKSQAIVAKTRKLKLYGLLS